MLHNKRTKWGRHDTDTLLLLCIIMSSVRLCLHASVLISRDEDCDHNYPTYIVYGTAGLA